MTLFKRQSWLIVIISLAWPMTGLSVEPSTGQGSEDALIVRPLGVIDGYMTDTISWKILELALEKSGRKFYLAPSRTIRLMRREDDQIRELGDEGNLIWAGSIFAPDTELLPVEIPILRGLGSYRYIWVPTADISKFSHIRTADDLKQFSILTGQNWGANYILENEGFDIRVGAAENLPRMLMAGRGDVLLWPIIGTFRMFEKYGVKDLDMMAVPNVVVRLPQVIYFWLAPEGSQDLHDALVSGLRAALADGSLDETIRSFPRIGEAYSNLETNDFVVIDIENPDLSAKARRELESIGLKVGE